MSESTETAGNEVIDAKVLYAVRDFKFSFKKKTKDAEGKETKRAPITLAVPVPTWDGIVAAIQADPKVRQFYIDMTEDAFKDRARQLLSDEEKPVMSQAELPLDQFNLSFIANIPKAERAGTDISKEDWDKFVADYIEVMTPVRDGDVERVTKAANIFAGKLNAVKTDKVVLQFLQTQFALWTENTKQLEDFADIAMFLDNRLTQFLTRESAATLDSL